MFFLIIVFIASNYRITSKDLLNLAKYLFRLRPIVRLTRPWQYLPKTVMLAWKSGRFIKLQIPGHFWGRGPWVAHPCFRLMEKRTLFSFSVGCCSSTLVYESSIDSVGTSLSFRSHNAASPWVKRGESRNNDPGHNNNRDSIRPGSFRCFFATWTLFVA